MALDKDKFTPDELAKRWGMTTQGLANWRYQGYGPKFMRPAKLVFYPVDEVLKWEKSSIRQKSTGKKRMRNRR